MLLRVPDVAKHLNCSTSLVYDLIASKRLGHHRIGRGQGGVRVSEEQLQAFLTQTEAGPERTGGDPSPPIPLRKIKPSSVPG